MFGCFFFNERCHIFPDEFSKHTKQGELGFHLKGHASFNPWVSQSYSLWFLWATFRSRLASILLTASGTLRITLSLQNCTAKSPDFCVSLSIFVLGSMDRLITYIGFPGWWVLPASVGDKRNLLQIWTNGWFLRSVSKDSCFKSRLPCWSSQSQLRWKTSAQRHKLHPWSVVTINTNLFMLSWGEFHQISCRF